MNTPIKLDSTHVPEHSTEETEIYAEAAFAQNAQECHVSGTLVVVVDYHKRFFYYCQLISYPVHWLTTCILPQIQILFGFYILVLRNHSLNYQLIVWYTCRQDSGPLQRRVLFHRA